MAISLRRLLAQYCENCTLKGSHAVLPHKEKHLTPKVTAWRFRDTPSDPTRTSRSMNLTRTPARAVVGWAACSAAWTFRSGRRSHWPSEDLMVSSPCCHPPGEDIWDRRASI